MDNSDEVSVSRVPFERERTRSIDKSASVLSHDGENLAVGIAWIVANRNRWDCRVDADRRRQRRILGCQQDTTLPDGNTTLGHRESESLIVGFHSEPGRDYARGLLGGRVASLVQHERNIHQLLSASG